MYPIICSNNTKTVISAIKDYLKNEPKGIKDILLVENGTQAVLLIDDKPIDRNSAKIWWNGYSEGLRVVLNNE